MAWIPKHRLVVPHVVGPEQLYLLGIDLSRLTFSVWGVAPGLGVGIGACPLPPQNVKFNINIMWECPRFHCPTLRPVPLQKINGLWAS